MTTNVTTSATSGLQRIVIDMPAVSSMSVNDPGVAAVLAAVITGIILVLIWALVRRQPAQQIITPVESPVVPSLVTPSRGFLDRWRYRSNGIPVTPVTRQQVASVDLLLQKVAGLATPPTSDQAREAAARFAVTQARAEARSIIAADPVKYSMFQNQDMLSVEPDFRELLLQEGNNAVRDKGVANEQIRHLEALLAGAQRERDAVITERDKLVADNTALRAINLNLSSEMAKHNTDLTTHHAANFRSAATSVRSQGEANDAAAQVISRQRDVLNAVELESLQKSYDKLREMFIKMFVILYQGPTPKTIEFMNEYGGEQVVKDAVDAWTLTPRPTNNQRKRRGPNDNPQT